MTDTYPGEVGPWPVYELREASPSHAAVTAFAIGQAIRAIKKEIQAAPPFHVRNNERRAEIDQLTDMLERRR